MLNKADDALDIRSGAFSNPFEEDDEGSADDLASFGIKVQRSEKFTPVYRPTAGG